MRNLLLILCLFATKMYAQPALELVKDLNPGDANSDPGLMAVMNDILYFRAYDGTNGRELWRTDGTDAGTYMVKNIGIAAADMCTSAYGCGPEFIVMNDILYFRATDNSHGAELWRSDGTEAGTYMVKDINPGISDCSNSIFMSAQYFCVLNDMLYFAADGGGNNIELWRSDGTEAGTVLLKDINPSGSSVPQFLTAINETIYFACKNEDGLGELWKTDGTDAGTIKLKQMWVRAFEYQNMFMLYDGSVFFCGDDDPSGYNMELWTTDGTPGGTNLFKELDPSDNGSDPNTFRIINDKLVFNADDGLERIFVSDGTVAGTQLLENADNDAFVSSKVFYQAANKIYFTGENENGDDGFWITDGTNAGTTFLSETIPEYFITAVSGNNVVYHAYDEDNGCTTVFQSDGTPSGTIQVYECEEITYPVDFTNYNGKIIFNGSDDDYGAELRMFTPEFAVGITGSERENKLQIFPNPASDQIVVSFDGIHQKSDIELYNVSGDLIRTIKQDVEKTIIPLNDLPSGLYLIRIGYNTTQFILE